MHNVPIKIKKGGHSLNQVADELKVDLRENLSVGEKQPLNRWLFLFVFLFLAALIFVISWNLFFTNKAVFSHLVPKEAVIFGLIDQESLYNQTASFHGFLQERNFYGYGAISKINNYLNQADLNFQSDFQSIFKKQFAFILMPPDAETSFPFMIIFEKNQSLAKLEHILSKVEPNIKRDYNFSTESYRQITMTILKPISSVASGLPDLYAYAQIEEYFIICNSKQTIKALIDSIID